MKDPCGENVKINLARARWDSGVRNGVEDASDRGETCVGKTWKLIGHVPDGIPGLEMAWRMLATGGRPVRGKK